MTKVLCKCEKAMSPRVAYSNSIVFFCDSCGRVRSVTYRDLSKSPDEFGWDGYA